ncbi:MAG TPA: hypothetical protein VM818_19265 [Vicinamibacterales bacterium]|nr:hypothetical protein [Vicinamibacterales bacterium]
MQLREGNLTAKFDPTPSPSGNAETFRTKARFHNVSGFDICNVFFQVVELSEGHKLEGVWIGPTEQPLQGFDQMIIGHHPVVCGTNSEADVSLTIDMVSRNFFNSFVNM